ncbi:Phospholipase D beta 2 [Acorus calamus]|uniref:phospholipase D n=1 Tax=Acorus calamus TaxID=4465 RepID=A0AAV9DIF4_ACOCL|nr:Phospholipase D beta 2 [Acorus calamus]
MEMMYRIIGEALEKAGMSSYCHPQDYLNFYCLGKREASSASNFPSKSHSTENSALKLAQRSRRFMIYVHAKGMIVDDEYVMMGSANINQRSLDGSRDTEIAMGAYQPHQTWAKEQKHPHGQVYGYRMSLWAEHLGLIEDLFSEPQTLSCVRRVNKLAEENWKAYVSDEVREMKGHLMKYPIRVERDGRIRPLPGHESFPDVGVIGVQICRQSRCLNDGTGDYLRWKRRKDISGGHTTFLTRPLSCKFASVEDLSSKASHVQMEIEFGWCEFLPNPMMPFGLISFLSQERPSMRGAKHSNVGEELYESVLTNHPAFMLINVHPNILSIGRPSCWLDLCSIFDEGCYQFIRVSGDTGVEKMRNQGIANMVLGSLAPGPALVLHMKSEQLRLTNKDIFEIATDGEMEVLERVLKYSREMGSETTSSSSVKKRLMMKLRMDGYDASLSRSTLVSSFGCPKGDYEYMDVMVMEDSTSTRLTVDIDFKSQLRW